MFFNSINTLRHHGTKVLRMASSTFVGRSGRIYEKQKVLRAGRKDISDDICLVKSVLDLTSASFLPSD